MHDDWPEVDVFPVYSLMDDCRVRPYGWSGWKMSQQSVNGPYNN
jgi:hypothetical protein